MLLLQGLFSPREIVHGRVPPRDQMDFLEINRIRFVCKKSPKKLFRTNNTHKKTVNLNVQGMYFPDIKA